LSVIALFVFPLAVIPVLKLGRRMRSVAHHTQEEFAKLSHHLTQVFQGIRVVKAYNTQEFEKKRFKNYGEQIFKLISKATRVRSLTHPIIEIIAGIALVLVISYGGFTVMKGERTTGEFISFIAALLLVYEPIKRLSHLNSSIQEGIVCGKRILDLLDKKPHIKNTSESQIKKILGHIQFCDVSFSYQNSSFQNSESSPLAQDKNGRKALKGISFEIKQGSCVAFVGSSGSGKSTLINLIARFYDVSEGNILIDDVPIQDIDLFTLRSSISLVSQDVFLFHGTILENIAYGRFYKSNGIQDIESIVHYREKIISAAQKSYAHEFIEKLPLQYDSIIGENGVTLSGGQRQRLSLARALFKDAAIFLLDEATSALDTHSERLIQKAFFELMKTKTTVMVAHRLSTIIGSHCIYVLNHGKIVEEGTHESLLSQKGAYASLWHEQSS
jgi:subfamily B ATP-binding cassette protein MsbA